MFALLALFGAWFIWSAISDVLAADNPWSAPPGALPNQVAPIFGLVFAGAWFAALGWNLYCFGWRIPDTVIVTSDDIVHWRLLFSSHSEPLDSFERLDPDLFGMAPRLSAPGPSFNLLVTTGFDEFARHLFARNRQLRPPPMTPIGRMRGAGGRKRSRLQVEHVPPAPGAATR